MLIELGQTEEGRPSTNINTNISIITSTRNDITISINISMTTNINTNITIIASININTSSGH